MSKEILNGLELPQQLLTFLGEVVEKTKGYDVYLGGGFVRDIYYNNLNWESFPMTPKDVDLFFIPTGDVAKELPTLPKTYVNYDKFATEIPDMEERGVERVRGLFVPSLDTHDVQFIVYKEPMTQDKLANDMDVNICQVNYSVKDKIFYATDAFLEGHEDGYIEMLHTFDFVRMGKRLARMANKFPTYYLEGDWNLTEFAESVSEHCGSFCEE